MRILGAEMQSKDQGEKSFQSILADLILRQQRGQSLDVAKLKREFPQYADSILEFIRSDELANEAFGRLRVPAPAKAIDGFNPASELLSLPDRPVAYFGEYQLLEVIGRGGMGVVYKARHQRLDRLVALKMISAGRLATQADVERFEREARAAAALQHPNIVSLHEIGQHAGQPYFTMEYFPGQNLAELLQQETLRAKEASRLVLVIAQAIAFSHEQGVIHRDLKPSNILFRHDGTPCVTDFGLAKLLFEEARDETELTASGQILGTPGYMSPEQATGNRNMIGPPTDVYSCGAILYACLCGRAPFVGDSHLHTIKQVLEAEPVRPRLLNPRVPSDLETICLKCLEKDRQARYGIHELIGDLERFLTGRPIKAKAISPVGRTWRWCKRNPAIASLTFSLIAALVLGLVFTSYYWRRSELALADVKAASIEARQNLHESYIREAESIRLARQPGFKESAWSRLQAATRLEGIQIDFPRIRRQAISCMGDFVGRTPITVAGADDELAYACSFLDEDTVAVALSDGDVTVRDIATGNELSRVHRYGQFSTVQAMHATDGNLIIGDSHGLERWEQARNGSWIRKWSTVGSFGTYNSFTLLDRGSRIAYGLANSIRIIDAERATLLKTIALDNEDIRPAWVAATSKGDLVAAADSMRTQFSVWSTEAGRRVGKCNVSTQIPVKGLQFCADGKFLLVGSDHGINQFLTEGLSEWSVSRTDRVAAMAASPNGRHVLSPLVSGEVPLREVLDQRVEATLNHPVPLSDQAGAAFSPAGTRCCTVGSGQARIWSLRPGSEKIVTSGHTETVKSCAFHPSLPILASGCTGGTVRLWNSVTGGLIAKMEPAKEAIQSICFHAGGRFLAVGIGRDKTVVEMWDIQNPESPVRTNAKLDLPWGINELAFSPDGKLLAVTGGGTKLWQVTLDSKDETMRLKEHKLQGQTTYGHHLRFSEDSSRLVVTPSIACWSFDASSRNKLAWRRSARIFRSNCEWLRSTRHIIGATMSGTVEVWDVLKQERIREFRFEQPIRSMLFSYCAKSHLCAVLAQPNEVSILEPSSGELLFQLGKEPSAVTDMKWNSAGKRLALGLADGAVSIWDLDEIAAQLIAAGLAGDLPPFQDKSLVRSQVNYNQEIKQQYWRSDPKRLRTEALAQALSSIGIQPSRPDAGERPEKAPNALLQKLMHNAGGAVGASGAFITSANIDDFKTIQKALEKRRYWIQCLRPYDQDNDLRFAACWRVAHKTRLRFPISKAELLNTTREMKSEGYRLIDLGGHLPAASGSTEETFWGIWESTTDTDVDQIVKVALDEDEIKTSFEELRVDHFPVVRQLYLDAADRARYCEVWEPADEGNSQIWMMYTMQPEQLREKFFTLNHLECQAVNLGQSRTSFSRLMSVIWRGVDKDVRTKTLHGVPIDILADAGKELLAQGYQPKSLCISGDARHHQQCAAIWIRQQN